jgi:hypothetical protein
MKPMSAAISTGTIAIAILSITLLAFQNCSKASFSSTSHDGTADAAGNPPAATPVPGGPTLPGDPNVPGIPNVCSGISCDLTPITTKTAVTTILLALGDQVNNQLVIKGVSAQLIAETVVRYTSPKANPKILFVHDADSTSESANDPAYVAHNLLSRYNVTYYDAPKSGLTSADLVGYDLIWFNNPGFPMGVVGTRDALLAFSGGVVLEGDDLSRGSNFDLTSLTGLTYKDNGTSIVCGNTTYNTDNNSGKQYQVNLNESLFTGASNLNSDFVYGNDIDLTVSARPDLEILATAKGSSADCTDLRPAIVRYMK